MFVDKPPIAVNPLNHRSSSTTARGRFAANFAPPMEFVYAHSNIVGC